MKRLITEISTLQTCLPEGIFVRHSNSRLDVLKILIIGPKDTPYEYGFFEFDLFCPLDYPQSPPKLQFRTTNNGRVRFNPNLYECGKVCLSLLGTWDGEPWRPKTSTLLQVLVSTQSMILCEQPWYNEPGRERVPGQEQSDEYNLEVRYWTLQHAILPWVNAFNASNPDPQHVMACLGWGQCWGDVVQTHLIANAHEIYSSNLKVAQVAGDSRKGRDLHNSLLNMRSALAKHGYLT
ncbi:ubiquitin-conjugating enzyme/RWD-like protein [Pseudomassariella vexata]|uniref:Ubiquitin-conjugating enzyme/RWD-like protein n=1 Tax=Pseudomassariella vexata TaxID=1141098 RepID=A0A1Y2EI02_9PEZI|nr:ubiquitin-conjugating enzyme/RWD-like protein [Pseudomassariella vexata]ORY70944.1 ubiquitin-conjugating enzyme/RWD-like protein [Pseudomassariella vexata]